MQVTIGLSEVEGRRIYSRTIEVGGVITVTDYVQVGPDDDYVLRWGNGREVISNEGGYTETHKIHVVAYDRAGNTSDSPPVRVHIIPERKDKDEDQ